MINTHDAIRAHMEGRLHKDRIIAFDPGSTLHHQVSVISEGQKKVDDLLVKSLDFILHDPVCRLHLAIASVKRANAAKPTVTYFHQPTTKRRGRPPGRKNK